MRHVLGVLGVLAAGVLLAVSCAMNWRFGYSLGKTEMDGVIYGSASAAADCMKALIPFFFFAAIRTRMWSQAAASAVLWVVVTAYSLTSALGHAALNRLDTAGQRTQSAQHYTDLRADLKRAEEQLGWVPQHRPQMTVQAEIDGVKTNRLWQGTSECTNTPGKTSRGFCQGYHALSAELAAAAQAEALEKRIAEVKSKLEATGGHTVLSQADPQAAVLASLASIVVPGTSVEQVQTALTVFVALLLEIGSGFGMYVAFSQWRIHERQAPAAPVMKTADLVAPAKVEIEAAPIAPAAMAVPVLTPVAEMQKPRSGANDNKSVPAQRLMAPETDVERFYREKIEVQDGSSVTATQLYEDYCSWCDTKKKEPLALPSFGREFAELGVKKEKIAGRVRYIGIALRSDMDVEEDKNQTALRADAA